jgi:hypothetical protein
VRWGYVALVILACGCELIFRPGGGSSSPMIDADPMQPDADPAQPDADPTQPDAPPAPPDGPPPAFDAAMCGVCYEPDPAGGAAMYFCGSGLDHCGDGPDHLDNHDFCSCVTAEPQLFVIQHPVQMNMFDVVVASTTVGDLYLEIDGGTCFGTVLLNCGGTCANPQVRFSIWGTFLLTSAESFAIYDEPSCAPSAFVASWTPFS